MLNTNKILTTTQDVNRWLKDNLKSAEELEQFTDYLRLKSIYENGDLCEWAVTDMHKKLILYRNKYGHLADYLSKHPYITVKDKLGSLSCSVSYYIYNKYSQEAAARDNLFKVRLLDKIKSYITA